MHRTHKYAKPRLPALYFIIFVILCSPSIAQADDYTDALQSEAADLSVDPETDANKPATAQKLVVDHNFGQEAFQTMLAQHYHGTYVFYKRLSSEKRLVAYEAYKKTPMIEPLRRLIMDLLVN
ncbi:MAG TPA: hypothetical protein EYH06_04530 [Chromatiales bacterium]|nr:hypothetical protein [Thiotrichales bacterium]HIP67841.1 hypothetical protein [Chromatiales bacterium]